MSSIENTLKQKSNTISRQNGTRKLPFFQNLRENTTDQSGIESFPQLVFAPVHYEPGYAYPLIIWLHGSGADERQLFRIMPKISMQNYVAAAPRGLMYSETSVFRPLKECRVGDQTRRISSTYDWPGNDVAVGKAEERIFSLIENTAFRYNINRKRIFLAGFDIGGTMALRVAAKYPEMFAGVVSLCGGFPEDNAPLANWEKVRSLPIMLSFGVRSRVFSAPEVIKNLHLFHTAGLLVSIRQYNAAQELTSHMLTDVNNWVMGQILNR